KNDLVEYIRASENDDSIGQAGVAVEKEQYDTGLSLSFGEVDDVDDEVKRKYTIVDLLSSSEKGDVEELDTIVRHGIPVHSTTKSGSSVLHYAARNGQSEMIRHLIDNYPACHVKGQFLDPAGYNVLHHAARSGNIEMFDKLLETGIDLKARTADGRSVLDLAGEAKQTDMVHHLARYDQFDSSYMQCKLSSL
ncbi:putative ankyrin repeat protein RF_0381, partial [Pecten maximus]|uniref:putative ankyrin repeat protein RF_0381 n=1 Tax=Pecten maximus TaxID=6579 RepID=UPI001458A049